MFRTGARVILLIFAMPLFAQTALFENVRRGFAKYYLGSSFLQLTEPIRAKKLQVEGIRELEALLPAGLIVSSTPECPWMRTSSAGFANPCIVINKTCRDGLDCVLSPPSMRGGGGSIDFQFHYEGNRDPSGTPKTNLQIVETFQSLCEGDISAVQTRDCRIPQQGKTTLFDAKIRIESSKAYGTHADFGSGLTYYTSIISLSPMGSVILPASEGRTGTLGSVIEYVRSTESIDREILLKMLFELKDLSH